MLVLHICVINWYISESVIDKIQGGIQMGWSFSKIMLVSGGAVLGGIAIAATGGLAAPLVGSAVGGAMGLSGAAATSAGLAALGGGSLAAGGAGMAGGIAAVTTALGAAGATGAGVAAAKLADKHAEAERRKKR